MRLLKELSRGKLDMHIDSDTMIAPGVEKRYEYFDFEKDHGCYARRILMRNDEFRKLEGMIEKIELHERSRNGGDPNFPQINCSYTPNQGGILEISAGVYYGRERHENVIRVIDETSDMFDKKLRDPEFLRLPGVLRR
ncbi:MAG: hypothetical protein ABR981_02905 [Candidatus Micrarchaeaceae archaeon]|jgi:hypothetical protein